MPINVFYTAFAYKGSTEELFKKATRKIKGPDYSKILYLNPTPWKIWDAQRIFHAVTGDCYIPPEMMTIKQLSKRLFQLYENKNIIPQSLTPVILSKLSDRTLGYSCLIADFINEIKRYHPGKTLETIASELRSIFDRFGIPEEVSSMAMEAANIMGRYQSMLKKCNAVDENDAMELCPCIIRQHTMRYDCLIIDGFYELTGIEETILKTLIDNALDTFISIPYDADYHFITVGYVNFINNNFMFKATYLDYEKPHMHLAHHPYRGEEEEIEGIARGIKNQFIAGTAPDLDKIIVVFPELHAYSDMLSRVFGKYGIPFTIASEKPFAKKKPFLDLLALLDSVSNDYPRLKFSQFLISPYFKALPTSFKEYIPSICIASGLTKGKNAWLNLMKSEEKYSYGELISGKESRAIEKDLAWVFKKLSHLESIRNNASFSDFSEAVMNLLNDFDFTDIGNQDINNRDKIIEILNELSFVDNLSNASPTDMHTFTEALKHCLNATSIETDNLGVRVMSFMDLAGLEPEHLYFGGLRDGALPSKPDIDLLLPDSVRTELGLVNVEKYLLLQRFLFTRALSSAKNYSLSYSVMEGDRLFLPSSFLSWNQEITKPVHGIFSREEELIRKSRVLLSSFISDVRVIDKRLIQKMFGEKSSIRVTDIDAYRTCPRKFFIEKVLSLKPLEIRKFEMEALVLGTIAHEIMQELLSEPFADLNTLILNAGKRIDALLSRRPLEDYWKKVIRDTFLSILPVIYELERKIADEGYTFMRAEVPVKGEVLKGITLKGKIDRIDNKIMSQELKDTSGDKNISLNYHVSSFGTPVIELIDYKTGATQFSGSQVLSQGVNLQLILYAALMNLTGVLVERVGIYSLRDLSLSWIPNRNDRKNGRTLEDYREAGLRFLEETVIKMRKGEFPALPLIEQICGNCPERPYCPSIQKAVMR